MLRCVKLNFKRSLISFSSLYTDSIASHKNSIVGDIEEVLTQHLSGGAFEDVKDDNNKTNELNSSIPQTQKEDVLSNPMKQSIASNSKQLSQQTNIRENRDYEDKNEKDLIKGTVNVNFSHLNIKS